MGFVQRNVGIRIRESEFTQIVCVDVHLRGNNYAKISKNLKLPTYASIYMHMKEDLKILRYWFCLKYGKLSISREFFQNSKCFKK
jgi:hypothetical protein